MIAKLKGLGVNLDMENIKGIAGQKGSLGRLHLAWALLEAKAVSSVNEAFKKYIGDKRPCYVEDAGFKTKEAIDLILKAGGVPVLAHPETIKDDSLVRKIIDCGIKGIEVFHTDHRSSASKKYKDMAIKHNLLITGGSDCHGMGKERVLMGTVKMPYAVVESLKDEAERIRRG